MGRAGDPFPLDHAAVFDAIPLPATLIDRRTELARDSTGAVAGALLLREKMTEQVEDHLGLERELVRRRSAPCPRCALRR